MRCVFLLFFTCLSTTAFCQVESADTDSYPDTVGVKYLRYDSATVSEFNAVWQKDPARHPLKRGFYKTFKEFLANEPSIQREFVLVQKTSEGRQEKGIHAVNFHPDPGQERVGHVWGFCDGYAVYVKVKRLEGKYWKLDYLGPYSYFVHVAQVRSSGGVLSAMLVGTREFSVINSHGKMIEASIFYMDNILSLDPPLAAAYANEKERNRKSEEVRISYLRRLNEYLAEKQL